MIVVSFFAPRYERFDVDYDELLVLLDKSCKKLNIKHMVISDCPRPEPLKTFLTYLPENLMRAFLYGQRQVLRETQEEILFTGADCLLVKDPKDCFLGDLMVTVSDTFTDCKLNTGAIFVKDPRKCLEIWQKALELEPKDWGEDQICFYKSVLESNLEINYLPCEDHNWAPKDINDDAGFSTIIHFRGKRKLFMKEWAKKYLNIE